MMERARRLVTGLGVVLGLLLLALAARLAQLQLHEHRAFAGIQWERSHRVREVAARRGAILDRFGRPLSTSVEAFEVWVWPPSLYEALSAAARRQDPRPTEEPEAAYEARLFARVRVDYEAALRPLAERLALWTRSEPAAVLARLRHDPSVEPRYRRIGEPAWDPTVTSELLASKRRGELPGCDVERTWVRREALATVGRTLLGKVGHDGAGVGGVEQGLEALLAGQAGQRRYTVDHRGREVVHLDDGLLALPRDGADVVLTIDAAIQQIVEEEARAALVAQRARWVSAALIDVATGDVLALGSATEDDARLALPALAPLQHQYPPGSTLKPVMMAMALDLGLVRTHERISCEGGVARFGGRVIHDSHPVDHPLTPREILVESSNVGMARVLARLVPSGTSRAEARTLMAPVHERLCALGLGARTGLPFPAERAGQLTPLGSWLRDYTLLSLSYGQELAVTGVQHAAVVAALADGMYRPPRIVRAWRGPDGVLAGEPVAPPRRVLSEAHCELVRAWMADAVRENRYADAFDVGLVVGGKTGTGDREEPSERGVVCASFVALAPADRPQLALAVAVDRPREARWASDVAVPLAAAILRRVVPYRGLAEPAAAPTLAASGSPSWR